MDDSNLPSLETFAAQLRASGFEPSPASLAEMHAALPHLRALQARVRRAYAYGDEPAHVYKAATPGTEG
jgi:hypothetical protein